MQELVVGDNNRTPVVFRGLDNLVFVGDIGNGQLEAYARNHQLLENRHNQYVVVGTVAIVTAVPNDVQSIIIKSRAKIAFTAVNDLFDCYLENQL